MWDAERLGGDGGGGSSSGIGPGKAISPEPLQQLPTGAFHFCQFALTRWRDEGTGKENDNSTASSNRSASDRGNVGRRRDISDSLGRRESKQQEHELHGGEEKGLAGAAEVAASPRPPPPSPPEEAEGEACMEEPRISDNSAFQENILLAPCGDQNSVSKSLFLPPHSLDHLRFVQDLGVCSRMRRVQLGIVLVLRAKGHCQENCRSRICSRGT